MSTDSTIVGVGQICIGKSPEVFRAVALGSCVAIALYDPHLKLGGLGHALLPYAAEARTPSYPPGKFANSATAMLVRKMVKNGAKPNRLVSKLAGGAKMFEMKKGLDWDIGARNVQSARAALDKANIPIVAEDVGKNFGRTVLFELSSGKLIILRAGGKNRREL